MEWQSITHSNSFINDIATVAFMTNMITRDQFATFMQYYSAKRDCEKSQGGIEYKGTIRN